MVMMISKAAHLAVSLDFQLMWGSYLAGWMADQRLMGFRLALTMTMAELTRWAILTPSMILFLCLRDSCLVGWMADQTPTVGPRTVTLVS